MMAYMAILTKNIKGIADNYDIVILDCPPSLGVLTMNALYAAKGIIIPVPPYMIDLTSTKEFFDMVHDIFTVYPDKEFAFERLLITKHRKNEERSHNFQLAKVIKKALGDESVLKSTMIMSDAIEKTSTDLKTIYDIKPNEFDGGRQTLKRALDSANAINHEIIGLIESYWENASDSEIRGQ